MPSPSAFRDQLLVRALELEERSSFAAIGAQTLVGFALWLRLMPPLPARPKAPLTFASLALAAALLLVGLVWVVGPVLAQAMTVVRETGVSAAQGSALLGMGLLVWARASGKRYLDAVRPQEN